MQSSGIIGERDGGDLGVGPRAKQCHSIGNGRAEASIWVVISLAVNGRAQALKAGNATDIGHLFRLVGWFHRCRGLEQFP